MKIHLTKGPTVSPALIPMPNPLTGEVEVAGFVGMSELDYVATHICANLLDPMDSEDDEEIVDRSIKIAKMLLAKVNPDVQNIRTD